MLGFLSSVESYLLISAPALFSLLVIIFLKLSYQKINPIFNIYQQPYPSGVYWFKVAFMYLVLSFKKAADAVYYSGASRNGDYVVVATARRKNCLVDGFMFLKINSSNFGVLQSLKVPDTSLYTPNESETYSAEGIQIDVIEPMKSWRIRYEGKMKESKDTNIEHDVKFEGVWTADSPYFNYDSDMDPLAMAKCMALETWGRGYFDTLKKNHQTHYEQFGILKATVTIDDKVHKVEFDILRDHTIAEQREWRTFRRYALHYATTENGDHFALGLICLPIHFSRLLIGFVYSAHDGKIYPVTSTDFELYKHGELGSPPKDYAFTFIAGGKRYTMQTNVLDTTHFYISKDWEAKIFERFCTFEINGKPGWGISEWQYRNVSGRSIK